MSEITPEVMTVDNEEQKLAAFTEPPTVVAGLKLRPFTAGSLILLKRTGNGLVTNNVQDLEFDVAAFIFAHHAKLSEVVAAGVSREAWNKAVMAYSLTLPIKDFMGAATQIQPILEGAMVGNDFETEDKSDPN